MAVTQEGEAASAIGVPSQALVPVSSCAEEVATVQWWRRACGGSSENLGGCWAAGVSLLPPAAIAEYVQ